MKSMTGFCARAVTLDVAGQAIEAEFELRAVNGRGLDIRLRVPEVLQFAEKNLRDAIAAQVARGNVNLSVKLRSDQANTDLTPDPAQLSQLFTALHQIAQTGRAQGVELAHPTTLEVLSARALQAHGPDFATLPPQDLGAIVVQALTDVLDEFDQMRRQEGAALARVVGAQIDQIAALTRDARALITQRQEMMQAHFHKVLAQTLKASAADSARLEQELALIALKADIAEELDRLEAHCAAAHALLASDGPVGRKLDFLTQEFNREANTLCSKAQHLDLTRIGLDLKAVIDQMREQVQNLE